MKGTLISVASEGGGAHAIDVMAGVADALCRAMKRSIPFLVRRKVELSFAEPQLMNADEVVDQLTGPCHVSHLVAEPGGARARLAFDARAVAFLLDGSLCGDGSKTQPLDAKGLSAAQKAFIEQLSESIVTGLSTTLERQIGLALTTMPQTRNGHSASGALVALTFTFMDADEPNASAEEDDFLFEDEQKKEDDETPEEPKEPHGTMVLAISKSALMSARVSHGKHTDVIDQRVIATMEEVCVDVVAELGRVVMSVAQLAALRVGHTLRVPVPVNGAVNVRVEDVPLFKARPTTSGSQLAIKLMDTTPPPVDEPERSSIAPAPRSVDLRA